MSRNMISVVRYATGWSVVVCTKKVIGWHAGHSFFIEGATLSALFGTLCERFGGTKSIVIGLSRSDFLIRMGTNRTKNQFPDAHRLIFWQRPIDQGGTRLTEIAAMRKDTVESMISQARDAGFTSVLIHPSWYGVTSGWPPVAPGGMLSVEDGVVQRTEKGWSPWKRVITADYSSISPEYHMNLGGLLLMFSRNVPVGWIYPEQSRGTWSVFGVMILVIVCMCIWFFSGVVKYTRAIGDERSRQEFFAESSWDPPGCTAEDMVQFFLDHRSKTDSTTYLTHFRYNGESAVELSGHSSSVGGARTFVERFNPEHFSITQAETHVVFSLSCKVPCDH